MANTCYIGAKDIDDDMDFSKLEAVDDQDIQFNKNIDDTNANLLKSYREEYIDSLRDEYHADDSLFENIYDLLEESEDQEKLIKVIDSL